LSVILLSVILLNVILLSVILLSVILLSVVFVMFNTADRNSSVCHYAEYKHDECQ
jgi:hypothetical protein